MDSESSRLRTVVVVSVAACIGLFAACSRSPYTLADVSGRVTLDGEPLAGGVVSFQPRAAGNAAPGPGSTGRLDAEGRFRLTAIDGAPGAVVGTHLVRIYSRSPESAPKGDSDAPGSRERVPARYNYESGLSFTVEPGGTATADFDLASDSQKASSSAR